jgi:hypothetical protein
MELAELLKLACQVICRSRRDRCRGLRRGSSIGLLLCLCIAGALGIGLVVFLLLGSRLFCIFLLLVMANDTGGADDNRCGYRSARDASSYDSSSYYSSSKHFDLQVIIRLAQPIQDFLPRS